MPRMPSTDRPSARPSTRVTKATARPNVASTPAKSLNASTVRKTRPATSPAGNGVKATKKTASARKEAEPAVEDEEQEVPTNMRSLPTRTITNVCDSVAVSRRFNGQSRCSAVAPDTTVWTGEADGTIAIRLASSGQDIGRIKAFGQAVVQVLMQVRGRMWAGYSDGSLRVYDPSSQAVLREATQHTAAVYAMCAADGFVYTGGADWKVYRWEAEDMHFSRMYSGHRNNVRCLTTYRDEETERRYIVSGSDDGTVKIWDASAAATTPVRRASSVEKDASLVATLDGQGRAALSMLVLEDTMELWVGSEDTAIRVWDLYSKTITSVVTVHQTPVVTLQRVEETIWSGSKDGTIAITNRFSKDVVHQMTQPPTRTAGGAHSRFNMSIQPVTRTIVYNVWATHSDGSWQCWNFTAPEGGKLPAEDEVPYLEGHYLAHSVPKKSTQTSQRRSHSVHGAGVAVEEAAATAETAPTAPLSEEDAELRESVARTRQSIAQLLMEPARSQHRTARGAASNGTMSSNAGEEQQPEETTAEPTNAAAGAAAGDIPIDQLAKSIQSDCAAETQREIEHQQSAFAKEATKAEKLRRQLAALGQDPEQLTSNVVLVDELRQRQHGAASIGSPTTERLEVLTLQLDIIKAKNAAMSAALAEAEAQK